MMTDGNYIYYGEHLVKCIIVKSLCGIPENNITLYINYITTFFKK